MANRKNDTAKEGISNQIPDKDATDFVMKAASGGDGNKTWQNGARNGKSQRIKDLDSAKAIHEKKQRLLSFL